MANHRADMEPWELELDHQLALKLMSTINADAHRIYNGRRVAYHQDFTSRETIRAERAVSYDFFAFETIPTDSFETLKQADLNDLLSEHL